MTTSASSEVLSLSKSPSSSSTPIASTSNAHLSYPSTETPADDAPALPSTQQRQLLKDRLYVGNLHPTVDEYSLLQVFSKFGKVTKLDFLFHKTGPAKGKPRGYAFVEYGSQDDALKALANANDKLLRGRKLVVTFAHQAPLDQFGPGSTGHGGKLRKGMMDASKPTTLSLLKTGMGARHDGTKDKIAMMEAKLRQMEAQSPVPSSGSTTSAHPSLPVKPTPASSAPIRSINQSSFTSASSTIGQGKTRAKPILPSLPLLPQSVAGSKSKTPTFGPQSYSPRMNGGQVATQKSTSSVLAGVRLRPKDRREAT